MEKKINPRTFTHSASGTEQNKASSAAVQAAQKTPEAARGIKWQSPEFDYYPKDSRWYWISILITLLVLAFAIWQKSFLFGFFVVIAEILILAWSGRKPGMIDFELSEKGLTIGGDKFYPYTELRAFSVPDFAPADPHFKQITLFFRHRLRTSTDIRIPEAGAAKIEAALKTKMPQIESDPSAIDILEKIIRF